MGFSIFLFGAIVGSFLNVLIYRLPLNISLINPSRSICPHCKEKISWYENIPIFSFVMLKGKCSSCKKPIAWQYPLVEIITAVTTLALYLVFGIGFDSFILVAMFYILIVLSFIDYKYKAVPDYLLMLALLVSLGFTDFSWKWALIFAGAFALLELFVTFYIQNIKAKILKDKSLESQKAMGDGDIPIAAIIGGILGLKLGILAIVFGSIFAIIHSLINMIKKDEIEIPFIPYLSLGLLSVLLFQEFFLGIVN